MGQALCLPHPGLSPPLGPGACWFCAPHLTPLSCHAAVSVSFSALVGRAPPHKGIRWWKVCWFYLYNKSKCEYGGDLPLGLGILTPQYYGLNLATLPG